MSNYTDKDTTCRCDYTKGYTFVTRPKHICYCVPTEEDCSCYRPICANINQGKYHIDSYFKVYIFVLIGKCVNKLLGRF